MSKSLWGKMALTENQKTKLDKYRKGLANELGFVPNRDQALKRLLLTHPDLK